jgi:hypothetical protein
MHVILLKAEEIKREKERRERGQKMEATDEERKKAQRKREIDRQMKEKEVGVMCYLC